jgi:hypothetical protein
MADTTMDRYLNLLGLEPGATLDEVTTTYYSHLEKLSKNPTEEDERLLQQLKHAYACLRRAYVPPPPKGLSVAVNTRVLFPVMAVLAVVLGAALFMMNRGNIKMMITRYEPGVVLRWEGQSAPYGQVVAYDARHRFSTGGPSAAYQIRLADKNETIWLSERIVVKAMLPAGSAIAPATPASVGAPAAPGPNVAPANAPR